MKKILLVIISALIIWSCEEDGTSPLLIPNRGELVEVLRESSMNTDAIELLFNQLSGGGFEIDVKNDVRIISVLYRTIDWNGDLVNASGLLVIPQNGDVHSLISLQHGTQSKRENVGSQNIRYGFEALIAGSIGYVAVAPDYLGFGESNTIHPYHHEETSAATVIDLLRAAREYCASNGINLNDQLFLAGYSQGGYVTMAAHKEIETNHSGEFTVTASAPMAGAHDLLLTARNVISNDTYDRPSFLSYIVYAYNEIYAWDMMDEIFKSPYHETVPILFDGSLPTWEIDSQLPNKISDLFKEDFINDFVEGNENPVINAFVENSLLDWSPSAPITLIHGNADDFVPYENAVNAKTELEANGGAQIQLVTIDGGTHSTSVLPAIQYTINWFETLRTDKSTSTNPISKIR
ncbi:MAG: lipase family protein [Melioribacteraceae bacterium]|nr:lipase family protein [Melioribacteraceae bacterium]MCF8355627.1 lipase family protein [Melioribacteraceae bacterium]MCF8394673.1 lipase family protein [Melioribacteraceae bacterium]MCF8417993.1 lipase family protein [Melioribacteraceae bacterium]